MAGEKGDDHGHELCGLVGLRIVAHRKVNVEQVDLEDQSAKPATSRRAAQLTSSACLWITSAILSRVKVSSLNRRLMSLRTLACVGFDSSRMFLKARYAWPSLLQKCCAKIHPQSARETWVSRIQYRVLKTRTCIGRLLHSVITTRSRARVEERVVGQTVEQGSLLLHLEDRVFNRRSIRAGQRVEV